MRSRSTLHKSKLDDFAQWLERRGWQHEEPLGYEVLRMRWPKELPPLSTSMLLLVYRKNEVKEHYTTYGIAQDLLIQWLRERKGK